MADGEIVQRTTLRPDVIGDAEQNAEEDQHRGDDPQRAERGLDLILEEQAQHDDRDAADDDQPPHPRVGIVPGNPAEQGEEPVSDDAHDVTPEEDHDGRFGADLRDRGEGGTGVLGGGQELAEDAQMGARGHGQELGESLHEAEHDRLEQLHGVAFR